MIFTRNTSLFIKVLSIPIVLTLLLSGFSSFVSVVFKKSSSAHIYSNLSQLPTTDIGYVYFDGNLHAESQLSYRIEDLLRSDKLDHLFIGFHPGHFDQALALQESLLIYRDRVELMPARENLVLSLYELCNNHQGCSFTIIGGDNALQQSIYIAQTFDQSAFGYLSPEQTLESKGFLTMKQAVETYLMLQLTAPEEYELLLSSK